MVFENMYLLQMVRMAEMKFGENQRWRLTYPLSTKPPLPHYFISTILPTTHYPSLTHRALRHGALPSIYIYGGKRKIIDLNKAVEIGKGKRRKRKMRLCLKERIGDNNGKFIG